ncbi:MAG: hypothetical protein HC789_22075 [Microcoleus sp. CSU_2_2]|nr:hypothetical protein [Microcoleus sp. CSU_2_2]
MSVRFEKYCLRLEVLPPRLNWLNPRRVSPIIDIIFEVDLSTGTTSIFLEIVKFKKFTSYFSGDLSVFQEVLPALAHGWIALESKRSCPVK